MIQLRPYIKIAGLLLLGGVLCGLALTLMLPQVVEGLFTMIFESLSELSETIFIEQGGVRGTITLFWHNFRAAMGMAVMGVAFGLYPLLGIALNGLIVGMVLAISLMEGQLLVFFVGILPHGVFEIPALILAAAAGLYLGWGPLKKPWVGYGAALAHIMDPLILASAMLVLAAFIEVGLTPFLLSLVLR
ncbi:MAG TPA: stage II sporulation protein M [Bacillota bacterium]|nr:stage II sporulation protein M [Bacillota bacterium]